MYFQSFFHKTLAFTNITRIKVQLPVYVAGFERGVRPIGDWSIRMARPRYSVPVNVLQLKISAERYLRSKRACKFLYKISYTKDDLPEPDTPVTVMSRPSGISTSMFLMLNTLPPRTCNSPFG